MRKSDAGAVLLPPLGVREALMRRYVRLGWLTMAAVLAAGSCKDDVGPTEVQNFTATLAKAPIGTPDTNSTTATGSATLAVVGGSIIYRIDVAGITGVTVAHIHGPAAPGGSAGVIVNFCGTTQSGTPTTPPCASGTVTGVLVSGVSSLTPGAGMTFDRLLTLRRTDSAYVNVHTSAHPGGEIRGTIKAQ